MIRKEDVRVSVEFSHCVLDRDNSNTIEFLFV